MSKFYTSYGENEKEIIRKGIPAIRSVLLGGDTDRKKGLLLALDWFMDPFYKQDISDIYDELLVLLQTVIISSEDSDVAEDAFNLLFSYAYPPFEILRRDMDQVPEDRKYLVQYLLSMEQDC